MGISTKKKTESESKVKEITSKPYRIDLHNDDYNTFDHVINCLIKICEHDYQQAHQCAQIVHYNGKCDVKYGDKETISSMKDKLRSNGLCATMVEN